MEQWQEVYKRKIPKSQYEMLLQNGEKRVNLNCSPQCMLLNWWYKLPLEGIVLNGLFVDEQIDKFRDTGFANVIYQIIKGDFVTNGMISI